MTTKLLLHCDGVDATTSFPDSSASNHTMTAGGNAQVDTAQFKFGTASALFDGTGDKISGDSGTGFVNGSGDWTIDFWMRPHTTAGAQMLYDQRPSATNGLYPTIYLVNAGSGFAVNYFVNSADRLNGTTALSADTWYHVAVVKHTGHTVIYLNGTKDHASDYTDGNTYVNGTSRPYLGLDGTNDLSGFNGWLDEVRVSDTALWTANFTPPTAPEGTATTTIATLLTAPTQAMTATERDNTVITMLMPSLIIEALLDQVILPMSIATNLPGFTQLLNGAAASGSGAGNTQNDAEPVIQDAGGTGFWWAWGGM